MKTAARFKAAEELIDAVFADREPADGIINAYFRERRYIGGSDRRFIADAVWDIIRHRRRLEFVAESGEARKILLCRCRERGDNLEEIFTGGEYAPAKLSAEEKQWLATRADRPYPPAVECECPDRLFAEINDASLLKSLNMPAPADFRAARGGREEVLAKMKAEGFDVRPTPFSPYGIRADGRINLNNCMVWQEGLIEVQDEASQLAALMCDVRPADTIIDYCCGAGGKTLALAALLAGSGLVEAHDVNPERTAPLKPRAARLGLNNIRLVAAPRPGGVYTRFVIDAPCSGSGTWRRAPDAKFRLTSERVDELSRIQAEILEKAYGLTAAGGRIIYITCSVLRRENEDVVEAFLARRKDMTVVDMPALWRQKTGCPWICPGSRYLKLNPLISNTDGFFVAVLEKKPTAGGGL